MTGKFITRIMRCIIIEKQLMIAEIVVEIVEEIV